MMGDGFDIENVRRLRLRECGDVDSLLREKSFYSGAG
jgi:hypothetical protein